MARIAGISQQATNLSAAEVAVLDAITAGTIAASKAIVVDANKDAADARNFSATNLKAGKDAAAGTVTVFPTTTAKGKAVWSVTDQTGNTQVTHQTAAMGQATVVTTPDPGAATASVVLTEGAQSINGVKTMASANIITHANTGLKIRDSDASSIVTIAPGDEAADRTLNIPVLGATDTLVTLGTAQLFTAQKTFAAGTTAIAPCKMQSGTNLTTDAAGAFEFDGAQYYQTAEATAGRAAVPLEQYVHLSAAGSTISTIANYFGTTSNITLVANAYYIIEVVAWFLNTTSGTVVWTLTNSAAPTSQNIYYEMSPVTGLVAPPGTATMLIGQIYNDATAAKALTATGALTDAVNHYMRMRIFLRNGTGTSLKIQATKSAGTITPGINSYWFCRRVSPNNIGILAA